MAENDPFGRPDATFIRPQPGGRRAPGDHSRTRVGPAPASVAEPISPETRAKLGVGLNPLVRAASPLLILVAQLRSTLSIADVSDLRRQTIAEIRQFENEARGLGVSNDSIIAARYVLCAALDEAVLGTPWGAQSEWAQHPLLVALHREAWGGNKFFEMLDRVSGDPGRYIDLMELQYLALAFGFRGKYDREDRGLEKLATVQHELYRKIRDYRGTPPAELSIEWRGVEDRRNPLIRFVPWWVVAVAGLVVLAAAFTFYQLSLARTAQPLQLALGKIGFDAPPPPPKPVPGPTLKQLLRDQEASGQLTVTEEGSRSIVTLRSGDMFASASATINPAYEATIMRIATELNKLPGQVLVIGHTDDQPLRSIRYGANNVELSRERAMSVVRVLQRTLTNPSRVNASGRGSAEPAFEPASDPANRARNRRVEIRHQPGA